VTKSGITFSADLGGSSKYSSEIIRLKADVEKGSMSTAIGHGLADPKRRGKPVSNTNKEGMIFEEIQI